MGIVKKFNYQDSTITFEFSDGNRMVHANQMALPFGKRVANFLRLKETKEYITLLESRYSHLSEREVLRVVQGGVPSSQGTWMDEKLALKFASWLSPTFELWVYDRVEELLLTGKTELPNQHPTTGIIKSIRLIADQLEFHEKEIGLIKEDIGEIKDYMNDLEAKITSIDENYYSISGYCGLYSIDCPQSKAQKLGIAATKLSHQKQTPIGKAYDAKFGNVNTYHIDILKTIII